MNALRYCLCSLLLALVAACGGSSGSAESEPDDGGTLLMVRGTASWHDPASSLRMPPAGTVVQLLQLNGTGAANEALAEAATDAQGRYSLSVPPGRKPGLGLVLSLSDQDGTTYRALVLSEHTDVGPASESFSREAFAAHASWQAVPAAETARLARFQRAAAQFLSASDPLRSTPEALVSELRTRLLLDPASRAVFTAIRDSSRVPNLGDIGAILGLGHAAWLAPNATGRTARWITRPSASTPGDYDVFVVEADQVHPARSARPTLSYRTERDSVTPVTPYFGGGSTDSAIVLTQLLGPLRIFEFGLEVGQAARLNEVHRSTDGYTFDADGRPDTLHYTTDMTVLGPERLDHFGSNILALKVSTSNLMQIDLSGGGSIRVAEHRTDWHVPFAGIVRSDTTVSGVGRNGETTVAQDTRALQAGVTNGVSWPGAVRVERRGIPWSSDESRMVRALGVSPRRTMTLYADSDWGNVPAGAAVVNIDDGRILSYKPLRSGSAPHTQVFLSRDGTKLYETILAGDSHGSPAIAADAAAAAGLIVTRYDATTLNEEATFTLPAEPSRAIPGLAYPRATSGDLVISPIDSSQFLVGALGTVFYSSEGIPAVSLWEPPTEYYGPNLPIPRAHAEQTSLYAWDEQLNEVWMTVRPPLADSRAVIVPVENQALQLARARPQPKLLDETGQPMEYLYVSERPRFTRDAVFVGDFKYKFSKADGRLLARNQHRAGDSGPNRYENHCEYQVDRIVCLSGSLDRGRSIAILSSDDFTVHSNMDLQASLRASSGAPSGYLVGGGFYQLGRNEFVLMSPFTSTTASQAALLLITVN